MIEVVDWFIRVILSGEEASGTLWTWCQGDEQEERLRIPVAGQQYLVYFIV